MQFRLIGNGIAGNDRVGHADDLDLLGPFDTLQQCGLSQGQTRFGTLQNVLQTLRRQRRVERQVGTACVLDRQGCHYLFPATFHDHRDQPVGHHAHTLKPRRQMPRFGSQLSITQLALRADHCQCVRGSKRLAVEQFVHQRRVDRSGIRHRQVCQRYQLRGVGAPGIRRQQTVQQRVVGDEHLLDHAHRKQFVDAVPVEQQVPFQLQQRVVQPHLRGLGDAVHVLGVQGVGQIEFGQFRRRLRQRAIEDNRHGGLLHTTGLGQLAQHSDPTDH